MACVHAVVSLRLPEPRSWFYEASVPQLSLRVEENHVLRKSPSSSIVAVIEGKSESHPFPQNHGDFAVAQQRPGSCICIHSASVEHFHDACLSQRE